MNDYWDWDGGDVSAQSSYIYLFFLTFSAE